LEACREKQEQTGEQASAYPDYLLRILYSERGDTDEF
jgi:hypothetical protein